MRYEPLAAGGLASYVLLGEPRFQYAAAERAHKYPSSPSTWEPLANGSFRYRAPHIELGTTFRPFPSIGSTDAIELVIDLSVQDEVRIRECAVQLALGPVASARTLDPSFRWRQVGDVWSNESTPLCIRAVGVDHGGLELRATRGLLAARLKRDGRLLAIQLILDSAALHPRRLHASGVDSLVPAPERGPGYKFTVQLILRHTMAATQEAPTLSRFPNGRQAAFAVTDHCDFDTAERLDTLLHGHGGQGAWLGRGLSMTKGVFSLESDISGRRPAATLADQRYRQLIERLHADGSEIAPHGVNESGNILPSVFKDAVARIAEEFAPRSWIDHGKSLRYCLSMGGAEDPEYDLLGVLRQHGFTTLWSYYDVPSSARASLNLLSPRANDIPASLAATSHHLLRGRALIAAHYLRSAIRFHTEGRTQQRLGAHMSAMRQFAMSIRAGDAVGPAFGAYLRKARATSGATRADAEEVRPPDRTALLQLAPFVYPVRGAPASSVRPSELLLFASQEVLHVRDVYTEPMLERLIGERGAHVGHCYLLNVLPYVAGIFHQAGGSLTLAPEWGAFLGALESRVADGTVWNAPISEIAEWMRDLQLLVCIPVDDTSLRIENPLDHVVRGLTVLVPRAVSRKDIYWGAARPTVHAPWHDWLPISGDLAAGTTVQVGWR